MKICNIYVDTTNMLWYHHSKQICLHHPAGDTEKGKEKMKRTKTMVYKPTQESRELVLFAANNGTLYEKEILTVINCLRKKAAKGTYNSEKAVDAWYRVACSASQMYYKDFGYSFTVTDRFTAAVELEKYFKEDVEQ